MRLKNIFLFFFLTFFVFNYGVSQNNEVGFFFGLTNYVGDVGPTTYINPFSDEKYSVFGVLYKKNISKRVAIRGGVNFAEIGSNDIWKGSSDYRAERAKSFKNKLEEINLSLEFNFREFDVTSANSKHPRIWFLKS